MQLFTAVLLLLVAISPRALGFEYARVIDDHSLATLLAPYQGAPPIVVTMPDGTKATFSLETTLIEIVERAPHVRHVLVIQLVRAIGDHRTIVWEQFRSLSGYYGSMTTVDLGPSFYDKEGIKNIEEPVLRTPTFALELHQAGADILWSILPQHGDQRHRIAHGPADVYRVSVAHTDAAVEADDFQLIVRVQRALKRYQSAGVFHESFPPLHRVFCRSGGYIDPARFSRFITAKPPDAQWEIVGPGPWGATVLGGNYAMPHAFAPPLHRAAQATADELVHLATQGNAYARSLAIWELDRRGDPVSLRRVRHLLNDRRPGLPQASMTVTLRADMSLHHKYDMECRVRTVEGQLREIYASWFGLDRLDPHKRDLSSDTIEKQYIDSLVDPLSLASVWVEYARRQLYPTYTTGPGASFPRARSSKEVIREGVLALSPDRRILAMILIDRSFIYNRAKPIFTDEERTQAALALSEIDLSNLRRGTLPGQPEPALKERIQSIDGLEMIAVGEAAASYATLVKSRVLQLE